MTRIGVLIASVKTRASLSRIQRSRLPRPRRAGGILQNTTSVLRVRRIEGGDLKESKRVETAKTTQGASVEM